MSYSLYFPCFHYMQLVPFLLFSWQSHADFPSISPTVCPVYLSCLVLPLPGSARCFAAGHCHCTFPSGSQTTLEVFPSFSLFSAWLLSLFLSTSAWASVRKCFLPPANGVYSSCFYLLANTADLR